LLPSSLPSNPPDTTALTPAPTPVASTPPSQPIPTPVSLVSSASDKGLTPGLVILGLLIALAGAFGFGKIPDRVLTEEVAAGDCPLDRREP
jgi:hypothetical protein